MGQSDATTYRAVVKYALNDDDRAKRRALIDGLLEIAHELADLGVSADDIGREFEDAVLGFRFDRGID